MKIGRAAGGVSAVGKPGTANQFQRRELVAVPVLRRAHRSAFSRKSRGCGISRPTSPKSVRTRPTRKKPSPPPCYNSICMFRKVLIANRGEIAVRVIRTLREMGIPSVAVFSDPDRTSLHVRMADEAAHVGPGPSAESYLRMDRILDAARRHGADAIHPGYGFLSENADFAAACEAAGLVFIGPSAASIRAVASKPPARRTAIAAGAPVIPGTDHPVTLEALHHFAATHGYPVLLKAVAGGGGKGMRRVDCDADLESAFRNASSEAERAFRSSETYAVRLIERSRHIEIQILGDRHGNMVHLGERECSIQRRHQKVIEECPSPLVDLRPEMRQAMGHAA